MIKKGTGRPLKKQPIEQLQEQQEVLFNEQQKHWTQFPFATRLLELLAIHGVYKLPIETGNKSKQKYSGFTPEAKLQAQEQTKKLSEFITEQAQNAQKLYQIHYPRGYYFIRDPDTQPQKVELVLEESSLPQFQFLMDSFLSLNESLQPQFALSLSSLLASMAKLIRQNVKKELLLEELVNEILDNRDSHKELLACQFIKERLRQVQELLNTENEQGYEMGDMFQQQLQPVSGNSKKVQKQNKEQKKMSEMDVFKEQEEPIIEQCQMINTFLEEVYEAMVKQL